MFDISNCCSHRTISLFLSHSRYHLWTDAVNTFVCVVMFFHGHVAWLILQGSILSWNIARIHIFYLLAPSPISWTMVTERSRESNPCAKLPAFTTATAPAIRSVLLAETCNAASSSWIPNQQTDVGHERHREPTITTEGTDQSAQVQLLTTPLISSAAIYAGYCRSVPLELQHLWCLLSNEKKRNETIPTTKVIRTTPKSTVVREARIYEEDDDAKKNIWHRLNYSLRIDFYISYKVF